MTVNACFQGGENGRGAKEKTGIKRIIIREVLADVKDFAVFDMYFCDIVNVNQAV